MKRIALKLTMIAALALPVGMTLQALAKDEAKTKVADTKEKTKAAADKKADKDSDKEPAIKFRMPNYYGQLELDDKQKDSIKAIYEEMTPKIDKVRKELSALEGERDEKYNKILTKDQKTKFYELKAKAKSKPEDSKDKADKPEKKAA